MQLSHEYGGNQDYVLLGGGNTSWKDNDVMYVKASGYALHSIAMEGFVQMDRSALDSIWEKSYPEDHEARENEVLQDMMHARVSGQRARPSVEALLHSFIPYAYVVHLHPAMVNGVTCGKKGKEAAARLFGDDMVWVDSVNPGYFLAKVVRDQALDHQKRTGNFPEMIFLQNHGVFVSADTPSEIREIYQRLMDTLQKEVVRIPDLSPMIIDAKREEIIQKGVRAGFGEDVKVIGFFNTELSRFLSSRDAAQPVSSAFTPDHIVYSGHTPLWVSEQALNAEDAVHQVQDAVKQYIKDEGVLPKIVLAEHTGAFGVAQSVRGAESAGLVFLDTVKVAVYSESFGGPRFMDEDKIDFIRNWESEKYRAQLHDDNKI